MVASHHFRVEDYELANARYALRVAEKEQRRGQPQAVYLRGTDANELPLLDARVRLVVVPQHEPGPLPGRQVFVPDTLWAHTQALDPVGETRVNLPAGILPDVDFGYEVRATFLTADNERHVETARVAYQRDPGQLRLTLGRDSVRLSYDSLGLARPHRATLAIAAGDAPGRAENPPRAVQLPLRMPLDFMAATYRLTDAAGRSARLEIDADNADLTLRSDRTADSVVLAVDNPHRAPFWYFVYRGNALRYRGYGLAYQLRTKDQSRAAWHVSLHYRWGAAVRVAEYTVGAPQRQLVVATDQPAVAYPGQKIKLGFTVTDERGRPVPDADLTAYAYNHKFDKPDLPGMPDFRRPVAGRQARRRFRLGGQFDDQAAARRPLPWAQWRTRLGLDSLRFYQFLYPETGLFQEYQPAPGGLTQVAPFVVDSGRVRAPIAVYVDGQPVYLHAINEHDPYPMVADSGRHTLSLRLPDCLLTLRNVYLRPRHKLTLSIDPRHPRPELTVEKRPLALAPAEQQVLARSIVLLDTPNEPAFTTLRQGQRLRVLRGDGYGLGRRRAGPFRPDSVLLRRADGLRLKFLFEPLYTYSPRPHLLKMVSVEPGQLGYLGSAGLPGRLPLAEFALTEAEVRPVLYPAPFEPEAPLDEPTQTPPGQGRLALRLPPRPDTARDRYPLPHGEQRSIAIVPAGTRERVGTYAVVTAADTTLTLPLDPKLGEVTVHLESDALPTLRAEIQHLHAYAYLCNEQMASKLLALLLERRICTAQKVAFRGDKAINFLVRKLQQSQRKAEGLWGTWATTAPSYWVSTHVLEALLGAEKAGFRVELNRPALQAYLLRELDTRLSIPTVAPTAAERRRGLVPRPTPAEADDQLRLLRLLHQRGAPTDYRTYLDRLDRAQPGRRALDRYLASAELRQQVGLPYQLDSLRRYRLRTELGGVYYADTAGSNTYYRYLLPGRVGTTLLAYRVLRTQGGHEAELARLRTFLLGLRGGGYWGSTYEAAQLLATIGPDLLAAAGPAAAPTQVQLRGPAAAEVVGRISKFPFTLQMPAPAGSLVLHKTGGLPVYATAYQTRQDPAPAPAARPFTLTTTLGGQAGGRVRLRAGQPAELLVTVDVKAEARYVLLEVPIPAGCSYGPAPTPNPLEVHRENLRHQTGIFLDYLPIGKHTFRVALQPRYRGQYTLNPARAELVYFPTKYGRTGSKQVKIQ